MKRSPTPKSRRRRLALVVLLGLSAAIALWIWWAEGHPREERRLRILVHDQLYDWFPESMTPDDDGWHGLSRRLGTDAAKGPRVVLVHGLDEPGDIWDDLLPVLGDAGFEVWEFRYPNDQGIDRSAAYLAEHWTRLPADRPVVLVGHSMGGLVIREFVSRWRHPVDAPPRIAGASIRGVILAGTPNHGSEWARLRVWLELRDQLSDRQGRRFSLFAALRDGTGEAKIDLRPESDFLEGLNARPWPRGVAILLIGGVLLEPSATTRHGIEAVSGDVTSLELEQALQAWWSGLGEELGDGVVTLASLGLTEAPPPTVVHASHRGMLRRFLDSDPEPPAIAPILGTLHRWDADVAE